jgi:hypothetical protein
MIGRRANVTEYLNISDTSAHVLVEATANKPKVTLVSLVMCCKTNGSITVEVDRGATDYAVFYAFAMTAGASQQLREHEITLKTGDSLKFTASGGSFSITGTFEVELNKGQRQN